MKIPSVRPLTAERTVLETKNSGGDLQQVFLAPDESGNNGKMKYSQCRSLESLHLLPWWSVFAAEISHKRSSIDQRSTNIFCRDRNWNAKIRQDTDRMYLSWGVKGKSQVRRLRKEHMMGRPAPEQP
jgi:hypothetical protein